MLGFAQCGDRTIHLVPIGAVAQRVGTQMCGAFGHRFGDLGSTVDPGPVECRCSENMVKVVVSQHDMANLAVCHGMHVGGDPPRLGQRRAAVHQHDSVPAANEAHSDVEKRQTATEHAGSKLFPDEFHCPSVSGSAARYCSSACGVGSAVK